MSVFLKAALEYAAMGFSVIPVSESEKTPKIQWAEFQTRRATPSEIVSWWSQWPNANVGIVTGKISGLLVVDLDRYKPDYDQNIESKLFPSLFVTPSALTPRYGIHRYMKSPDEEISGRANVLPGVDIRSEGNYIIAPPSQNGSGRKYEWVDGQSLSDLALSDVPEEFLKAIINNKYYLYMHRKVVDNGKSSPQVSTSSTTVHDVYKSGRRDEDIFHLANALVKGRCHPDIIQKTLEIIANNCDPPFSGEEAKAKLSSALKRAADRDRNIMAEVREWVLSTSGIFLSTMVINELQLSTREQRKNVSICLKRLCEAKVIEKYGNKSGAFRTLDNTEEIIEYKNVDLRPLDIKLPMGIMELVEINRGNIIVLAGESNSGKTAFLLNVAIDNCIKHKVNYMSSEMNDGVELRRRLNKFNIPLESWDPIKFQFRTDNFPEKVTPDGFNIIDYLDEGSDAEAHKMPSRLRDIADKLKGGVAFVAIQKDPNKVFGYGGSGTLNRSRLYLTITTQNILKIVKAKIWRDDFKNPNGLFCKFKLAAGCAFRLEDGWKR